MKDYKKLFEAALVIGGLVVSAIYGRVWNYFTIAAYILINSPQLLKWLQGKLPKLK